LQFVKAFGHFLLIILALMFICAIELILDDAALVTAICPMKTCVELVILRFEYALSNNVFKYILFITKSDGSILVD
jgi:hypothetical protein